MDKLLHYAIESALSLAVLFLFYWIFMRNSTHFRLNRFIIMLSVISSLVLPILANQLSMPEAGKLFMVINFVAPEVALTSPAMNSPSAPETQYSYLDIIGLIYLIGAVIIMARLIYQAIYLHAVSRLSKTSVHQGFKIFSLDTDMVPFSYFNRIFIPADRINEHALDSVITHEKSHLSQGHYLDLFILQIVTVLQWFNPFIWLFEKSLKEVHEYLADKAVLDSGTNMGNYQAVLVNEAFGGPVFILTNQLNKSLIKKRILMMKNTESSKIVQLKALLIVPLLAALLLAFANPSLISQTGGDQITVKGNISDRYSGNPISGSVVVIKGTTNGTVTDLEGNYKMVVNGSNDKLIVSCTGYRTQEISVGKNSRINVQMEPDIIAIDFAQGNKFILAENPATMNKKDHSGESKTGGDFVFIEELPAYPGGTLALQEFILKNLKYPEEAKNSGLEGTVLVSYIIDLNGQIKSPRIIRGLAPEMDNEALRVTKLIKGWKPASQGGHPVAATVTMPVEFTLE